MMIKLIAPAQRQWSIHRLHGDLCKRCRTTDPLEVTQLCIQTAYEHWAANGSFIGTDIQIGAEALINRVDLDAWRSALPIDVKSGITNLMFDDGQLMASYKYLVKQNKTKLLEKVLSKCRRSASRMQGLCQNAGGVLVKMQGIVPRY